MNKELRALYRDIEVRSEHIDEEKRTVEIAFSSEEPVERFFGDEILDHKPESVRLGRLNGNGPFLVDHNPRDLVGVVEKATIDKDGRGRALIRFGSSERASEIFKDIIDGIRKSISVGYRIYKGVREEIEGDKDTFRIMDWEPLEISSVSIPADTTVGVGRNATETNICKFEGKIMTKEAKKDDALPSEKRVTITEPVKQTVSVDVDKLKTEVSTTARNAGIKEERERCATLEKMGKDYKGEELADEVIRNGGSVKDLQEKLLKRLADTREKPVDYGDIGLDEKESKRFSFLRAINALANPNNRKAQDLAAFEWECSSAISRQYDQQPQGMFVPNEAKRVLSSGTATDGLELVSTNLLSANFVDVLRNAMQVRAAGATILDGLVGDVAIPRKTTGSAAAFLAAEDDAVALSEAQFDQITMVPRTLGAYTEITRQLVLQSSLGIENLIRDDLAMAAALAIDNSAINGSGASGNPTGILNVSGIGDEPGGTNGLAPAWANIINIKKDVDVANAMTGALAWMVNADTTAKLQTTEKASSTAQFIMGDAANAMAGFPVFHSNQVPNNLTKGTGTNLSAIIFGNWRDLLIGQWGGMDILIDPFTNSLRGRIRIVVHQSMDIAVRHPESFGAMQDAITV